MSGKLDKSPSNHSTINISKFKLKCILSSLVLLATLIRADELKDLVLAKEGSDLDLSCPIDESSSSDDMIISWTCDEQPPSIKSSRIHVTEMGKLRIHNAKQGDSCNYRCEAAQGFGTVSVLIKVLIVDRNYIERMHREHKKHQQLEQRQQNATSTTRYDRLVGLTTPPINAQNHHHHQRQQHTISNLASNVLKMHPTAINMNTNGNGNFHTLSSSHAEKPPLGKSLGPGGSPSFNGGVSIPNDKRRDECATSGKLVQPRDRELADPIGRSRATTKTSTTFRDSNTREPIVGNPANSAVNLQATDDYNDDNNHNNHDNHKHDNVDADASLDHETSSSSNDDDDHGNQHPAPANSNANINCNNNNNNDDDMEIQIEPKEINIAKGSAFNLECRVKHPLDVRMAPQILWLKEFIGQQKPSSIKEAHEQSLLLIDNIYYHTLNWPKQITYDKRITSSSSALLVRHASFVHSGNYICFAGFPPTLMMVGPTLNLTSNLPSQTTTTTTTTASSGLSSTGSSRSVRSIMRYKMAKSLVIVDDDSDPGREIASRISGASRPSDGRLGQDSSSFIYRWFWRNRWTRAATIVVLIMISMWLMYGLGNLFSFYHRSSVNNNNDIPVPGITNVTTSVPGFRSFYPSANSNIIMTSMPNTSNNNDHIFTPETR